MPSLKHVIGIFLVGTVLVLSNGNAEEKRTEPKSVEAILQQAIAESRAPGIGVVVTNSGGTVDLAVVGTKRADRTTPLEPDDPFHIGSVTKPLTATVIARIVEAGSLAWDVPVADVLPSVMRSARPEFKTVTLAHLLAHEAGLKPMEEDAELAEVPELPGDIRAQRKHFARWVFQQEPTVTPTTEYRYSNAHYVVAAAMAEAVTDKSWEELIKEHIFKAFDMNSAGFGWAGKHGEDVPWGHRLRDGEFDPVDPNGEYQLPQYFGPAGDIHASLPAMAGFLKGLLMVWRGESDYLDRKTLQHMMTRRKRGGLGWGVTAAFGFDRVATYSGSADTFLMVVVLIPDADLGFAVVANAFSEEVERAVIQALRATVRLYVPEQNTEATTQKR